MKLMITLMREKNRLTNTMHKNTLTNIVHNESFSAGQDYDLYDDELLDASLAKRNSKTNRKSVRKVQKKGIQTKIKAQDSNEIHSKDLVKARILEVHRGRYRAWVFEDDIINISNIITLIKSSKLGGNNIVVGDVVNFKPIKNNNSYEHNDAKNFENTQDNAQEITQKITGRIISVDKPKTQLIRRTKGEKVHKIANNIDTVVLLESATFPKKDETIHKNVKEYCKKNNLEFICVTTKSENIAKDEIENSSEIYARINQDSSYEISENFNNLVKGKTIVLAGQSGVGKTTMFNSFTHLNRIAKNVSSKSGEGTHTSSSTCLRPVFLNTSKTPSFFIIDTPGFRFWA